MQFKQQGILPIGSVLQIHYTILLDTIFYQFKVHTNSSNNVVTFIVICNLYSKMTVKDELNVAKNDSLITTSSTTDNVAEFTTTGVPSTKAPPGLLDRYMFHVMGSVLAVVFLIILLIAIVFCIKQNRRRRQNREILRNCRRVPQSNIFEITIDEADFRNAGQRVQSTHHALYGQNMPRDDPDDDHVFNESPPNSPVTTPPFPKSNGNYANSDVVVNSDSMYDIPKATGSFNVLKNEDDKERHDDTVSSGKVGRTFSGQNSPLLLNKKEIHGKDKIRAVTKGHTPNDKQVNTSVKTSQPHAKTDNVNRNIKAKTEEDNSGESHDYENSPAKLQMETFKPGEQLKKVPPPNNKKMKGLKNQERPKMTNKKTTTTIDSRQDSEYEDPDKIIGIRGNIKKEEPSGTNSEYSNLIIPGLVVKSERYPNKTKPGEYENEETIKELKRKGPPLQKRRAHTTAAFDRPSRPVVLKKTRTYSNADEKHLDADDMYLPMHGALEEDDLYLPMDSSESNPKLPSLNKKHKTSPKPAKNKPEVLPKPQKQMVPKRSFDKSVLLSVKPPPCRVNRSNTEYVNYEENSRYVNLFRSKSNDDVYIYADASFDTN